MIYALDSSAWQSNTAFNSTTMTLAPGWRAPDFSVAARKGIAGNIARCSIGNRVDPYYAPCHQAALDAGIVAAAYHWLEGLALVDEIGAVARAIDNAPPRFFMLDVEDNDMTADVWHDRKLLDYVFGFLELVAAHVTNRIAYTADWWWDARVSRAVAIEYADDFARYDLMVAHYPHQPQPPKGVDANAWRLANWPVVPTDPARWEQWLVTAQTAPNGRVDVGEPPDVPIGWDTWDGQQGGSWALARDYGFTSPARLDYNIVKPDAWARWTATPTIPEVPHLSYDPDLRIPWEYGTRYITLREAMVIMLAEGYDPEYLRRLFCWLTFKAGAIGIGSRSRVNQPDKPGVAPEGKSFHQKQRFADGRLLVCAVDLVAPDGPDGNNAHDGVTWAIVAKQGSAEATRFGVHCNVDQGATPEAWHMQPIEIDGWLSWVNAGRPNIRVGYPLPDDEQPRPPHVPTTEDDMSAPATCYLAGVPWVFWLHTDGGLYVKGGDGAADNIGAPAGVTLTQDIAAIPDPVRLGGVYVWVYDTDGRLWLRHWSGGANAWDDWFAPA